MENYSAVDLHNMTVEELSAAFGCTTRTVYLWLEDVDNPLPRLSNGNFDLPTCHKWVVAKNKKTTKSAKDKKTEIEIEILQEKLKRLQETTIERDLHDKILNSRAASLREYWTDVFAKNIHLFAHKPVDDLRKEYKRLIKRAMENYLNG